MQMNRRHCSFKNIKFHSILKFLLLSPLFARVQVALASKIKGEAIVRRQKFSLYTDNVFLLGNY